MKTLKTAHDAHTHTHSKPKRQEKKEEEGEELEEDGEKRQPALAMATSINVSKIAGCKDAFCLLGLKYQAGNLKPLEQQQQGAGVGAGGGSRSSRQLAECEAQKPN